MTSPYELFGDEKRVLESPTDISGINVSDTFTRIEKKVSDSMKNLVRYSVYLDRMDDERYAPAAKIKEIISNGSELSSIVRLILRTNSISAERRLAIAAALLDVSSDHIISTMNDGLRQKAIAKPLEEVMKDLSLVINENTKNESWKKVNDFIKRRDQRVSKMDRIVTFRSVPGQWLAFCISCAQHNHHQDLRQAVSSVNHDSECIYKDDLEGNNSFKKMLLHYKTIKGKKG